MSLNPTAPSFEYPSVTPETKAGTIPSGPSATHAAQGKIHDTCRFWARGICRYSSEDCLYLHRQISRTGGGGAHSKHGGKRIGPRTHQTCHKPNAVMKLPGASGKRPEARHPMYRHWRSRSTAVPVVDDAMIKGQIAAIHRRAQISQQEREKDWMKENVVRGQNSMIRQGHSTLTATTNHIDQSCKNLEAIGAGRPDILREVSKIQQALAEQKTLVALLGETIPEVETLLRGQGLDHWLNHEEDDAAVAAAQGVE